MSVQPVGGVVDLPCPGDRSASAAVRTAEGSWSVSRRGEVIQVGYGRRPDFPQYAALHTDSGFLRLNYGPHSAWGTSLILLPCFWFGDHYYQGAPIDVDWQDDGADLLISLSGSICALRAQGQVRLAPPGRNIFSGTVTVRVDGKLQLDCRPGEAFKPVALSSMHISADHWDAWSAQVDSLSVPIPDRGWTIQPTTVGRRFALEAGSSAWKTNAPTIEILMDEARGIAGWKSESSSPDDDNLSVWAATSEVLRAWEYAFVAKP